MFCLDILTARAMTTALAISLYYNNNNFFTLKYTPNIHSITVSPGRVNTYIYIFRCGNFKKTVYKYRSLYIPYFLLSVFMMITVISSPSIVSMLYIHQNAMAKSVTTCFGVNSNRPLPSSPIPSNKTLSVRGNIDLTSLSIKLEPFMILPGSKYTTRPANSSFSINLLDSEGKILAHYPFNPKISTYIPEYKHKMGLLSEAVPYDLCTKKIVISKDGRDLASRNVSAHTPQVRIIFPNEGKILADKVTVSWHGIDADGNGNLTYSLLYSTDDGLTWQTVADNIKQSELTVNMTDLPGSPMALFRIIATDGVNTAIADSAHTLTVPSKAPIG